MIAEGVENETQVGLLRRLGCEYRQGHVFSRPLSAEAAKNLLAGWMPERVAARGEAGPV
jgi:EAL domain-containing protein (putative c-di-GMP-specific phosphodiesterase class I)